MLSQEFAFGSVESNGDALKQVTLLNFPAPGLSCHIPAHWLWSRCCEPVGCFGSAPNSIPWFYCDRPKSAPTSVLHHFSMLSQLRQFLFILSVCANSFIFCLSLREFLLILSVCVNYFTLPYSQLVQCSSLFVVVPAGFSHYLLLEFRWAVLFCPTVGLRSSLCVFLLFIYWNKIESCGILAHFNHHVLLTQATSQLVSAAWGLSSVLT